MRSYARTPCAILAGKSSAGCGATSIAGAYSASASFAPSPGRLESTPRLTTPLRLNYLDGAPSADRAQSTYVMRSWSGA